MGLRARAKAKTLKQQDARLVGRDDEPTDLQIVRSDGCILHDARGRSYIDFLSGWCVGNLGWNRPEIDERLRAFEGPTYVAASMMYAPWVELAEQLAELTPGALERCYRATGGTESVEFALQIARAYTGRDKVVAIEDDYHGNSTAVKAVAHRLKPPLDERALPRLERLLEHKQVAALLMEPVITNLAVEVPTLEFVQGAKALCERYGTLFVADEVATGFGRCGALFASDLYGIEPDILCLAKAMSNGAAPIGATLTTAAIADAIEDVEMYSTYGWHPLATEAALAVCDIWRREEDVLLAQIAERSEQFAEAFARMDLPEEVAIRIKGLAIGIDLPEGASADDVVDGCRERGLVVEGEEDQLSLFPPLTIDRNTAEQGVEVLGEVLGKVVG